MPRLLSLMYHNLCHLHVWQIIYGILMCDVTHYYITHPKQWYQVNSFCYVTGLMWWFISSSCAWLPIYSICKLVYVTNVCDVTHYYITHPKQRWYQVNSFWCVTGLMWLFISFPCVTWLIVYYVYILIYVIHMCDILMCAVAHVIIHIIFMCDMTHCILCIHINLCHSHVWH